MFTKWMKRKEKIQEKGGEKKMKRAIVVMPVIAILTWLTLPYAAITAADIEPFNNTMQRIDSTYDAKGKLTNQGLSIYSTGFANLGGQSYAYTINTDIKYKISNGRAYEETIDTTENQYGGDGSTTTIKTTVTYRYDTRNRLIGATGTRTTTMNLPESYNDTDENEAQDEGETVSAQHSEETEVLTFKIINGQAQEIGATSTTKLYDSANKTNLLQETTSTSERTYQIVNGVTKLVDVTKTSTTKSSGIGTVNNQLPTGTTLQKTHYAYDSSGNYMPTTSNISIKSRDAKDAKGNLLKDASGNTIQEQVFVGSAGGEIITVSGANDKEKIEKIAYYLTGSYAITYSPKTDSKGQSGEWVDPKEVGITRYKLVNGALVVDNSGAQRQYQ